jgi:hypothetical protein
MTPRGRRGVSCHVDNDDLRCWRFERSSGLPWDYFDKPLWPRAANVLVILIPAIGVVLALWFQW